MGLYGWLKKIDFFSVSGLPKFDESLKKKYPTDEEFVNFLKSKSNVPDSFSWKDEGGVTTIKDQVLKNIQLLTLNSFLNKNHHPMYTLAGFDPTSALSLTPYNTTSCIGTYVCTYAAAIRAVYIKLFFNLKAPPYTQAGS
jgi:hypothetical protein